MRGSVKKNILAACKDSRISLCNSIKKNKKNIYLKYTTNNLPSPYCLEKCLFFPTGRLLLFLLLLAPFFSHGDKCSQLLSSCLCCTVEQLGFRGYVISERFLLRYGRILKLFKCCRPFFQGVAPLHKMKHLTSLKISKGYFCPRYDYTLSLCNMLFTYAFALLTLLVAIRSQLQTSVRCICLILALLSCLCLWHNTGLYTCVELKINKCSICSQANSSFIFCRNLVCCSREGLLCTNGAGDVLSPKLFMVSWRLHICGSWCNSV